MTASLQNRLRSSLDADKRKLQERLDAAHAAKGRVPGQAPSKATVCVSFSMPPTEAALIPELQARAAREGRVAFNSEIARAAILHLSTLTPQELTGALDKVERIKPGRKGEPH